jgi:ABC-type antimicrobial peptide transport system permease subunit
LAAAAAATLGGVTSVSTHADAVESSSLEVTARGVFAGLTGGLAFAAAFGIFGTILHAVASYRSRTGEHAVLRAVGLGRSSTFGSIATEQTLLIGFATIAGLGLGTVVSWLTVPHTIGRLAGLPELPRLELTVPWQVLAALAVSAAILLGVIVAVAAASLRTVSITSVLRAGEEA